MTEEEIAAIGRDYQRRLFVRNCRDLIANWQARAGMIAGFAEHDVVIRREMDTLLKASNELVAILAPVALTGDGA